MITSSRKTVTFAKKTVTSAMSWPRLMGLLQTDGNIYFLIELNKCFRPKITFSVTSKRPEFIKKIVDFLKKEDLNPQISPKNYLKVVNDNERGVNIYLERQKEVGKFLEKLTSCEKNKNFVSCLGEKKVDLEILKKVFLLNKERIETKDLMEKNTLLKQIFSLKLYLSENRIGPKHKIEQLLKKFDLGDIDELRGISDNMRDACIKKARESDSLILQNNFEAVENISHEMGEFLSGVWDGDGSFQVNFFSHLDTTGNKVLVTPKDPTRSSWFRRCLEIKPQITLSDKATNKSELNPLFQLANHVFIGQIKAVSSDQQANRFICNSDDNLKKRVIPFFEKFPPSTESGLNRFEIMKYIFNHKDVALEQKQVMIDCVRKVYESSFFDESLRSKTLEEILKLIDKDFGVL
jgi:hypothetical protein